LQWGGPNGGDLEIRPKSGEVPAASKDAAAPESPIIDTTAKAASDSDENFGPGNDDDEESVMDGVKGQNSGEIHPPKKPESSDDDSSDSSNDEDDQVEVVGVKEAPPKSNSESDSSSVSSDSTVEDPVLNSYLEAPGRARAKDNTATITGGENSNSAAVGGPTRTTEISSTGTNKKGGQARAKASTTNKSSGTKNLSGSKRKSTETDFFTYGGEEPPKKKRTKYVHKGRTPKKIVQKINEAMSYLEGSTTFNRSDDVIENLKKQKEFLIKKVHAEYKKRKEELEEDEEEDMEVDGVDEPSVSGRSNHDGEGGAPGASGVTA